MGKRNMIQALPSRAVYPDASIHLLDDLTMEEKETYTELLVSSLEEQMNYYFLQNPEQWKHIL